MMPPPLRSSWWLGLTTRAVVRRRLGQRRTFVRMRHLCATFARGRAGVGTVDVTASAIEAVRRGLGNALQGRSSLRPALVGTGRAGSSLLGSVCLFCTCQCTSPRLPVYIVRWEGRAHWAGSALNVLSWNEQSRTANITSSTIYVAVDSAAAR